MTDASLRAPEFEVVFYGSEQHYRDHLWPVFEVGTNQRGNLWSWAGSTAGDGDVSQVSGRIAVVAASGDMLKARLARARKIVLMQHGAGQSYLSGAKKYQHSSYPGGRGHERAALALFPNQQSYDHHYQRYGGRVPAEVVGCPKLDSWVGLPPKPRSDPPMVVISFHWRCKVAREAGTVWDDYGWDAIHALVEMRDAGEIDLAVHAHPRIYDAVDAADPGTLCVPMIRTFHEVRDVADLYVCDNSSTMFEFAALDRPVVVMNSPRWRRDVHHGGRFWDWATVGPQVSGADGLPEAIATALSDGHGTDWARRSVVSEVYPYLGSASQRAAAAIERLERS